MFVSVWPTGSGGKSWGLSVFEGVCWGFTAPQVPQINNLEFVGIFTSRVSDPLDLDVSVSAAFATFWT